MKKKTCQTCQYQRPEGQMNADILGVGAWCSNSQAPHFRNRVAADHTCQKYARRGKKAPLALRLANKALDKLEK